MLDLRGARIWSEKDIQGASLNEPLHSDSVKRGARRVSPGQSLPNPSPMPSPESPRHSLVDRITAHGWWVLLLGALALLAIETGRRIDRVDALTNSPTWSVDVPARDAASATGFEHGQRTLIVPGLHGPSFRWIMEAQKSVKDGKLRLRHIDYDAQPDGRETQRTAPYRWWLIVVGWLHRTLFGEPLGYAIERGALIADPLLLGLLLALGAAYAARYFGPVAAIGYTVGGICLFPLAANFQPGAPDPHSLAWVLALGSILPLLVPPRKDGASNRNHLVVAGIFGGLGLWNDAKSQLPVLLAIVVGGIVSEYIRCRRPGRAPVARSSWRAWALAGALTTLAASVFEFAPNHFSWSLDAVSPIHAVAWWGFGEVLRAVQVWAGEGRKGFDGRSLALLGLGVLAVAAWPVTGGLTGSGGLLAPDFYALELANHPDGGTAANLGAWLHEAGSPGAKWATLLPVALWLVVLGRMLLGRIEREERGRLLLILLVSIFAVVLARFQLRWWNLFDIVALALLTVLLGGADPGQTRSRWMRLGAVGLLLPGVFVGFPPAGGGGVKGVTPLDAQALVARDFSYWLVRRSGPTRDVVFSTPIFSTAAAYYGGFDVVVSSDEEDKTGYLAALRIATASSLDEASVLILSRRVTRVALPLWDPMLANLVRVGRKLGPADPLPDDALLVGLLRWGSPVWMQPMNYEVPAQTGLKSFQLVCYSVQAPMATDLFLSRLADFFVERGALDDAAAVAKALKEYPRSPVALGAVAKIDLVRQDRAHLAETLETLIPTLSRISARHLPVDRRISIAGVLLQTQHPDPARAQFTEAMKQLDAATLQTLTPGTVEDLLALSRALALPLPNPGLETTALSLIPPSARERFGRK